MSSSSKTREIVLGDLGEEQEEWEIEPLTIPAEIPVEAPAEPVPA